MISPYLNCKRLVSSHPPRPVSWYNQCRTCRLGPDRGSLDRKEQSNTDKTLHSRRPVAHCRDQKTTEGALRHDLVDRPLGSPRAPSLKAVAVPGSYTASKRGLPAANSHGSCATGRCWSMQIPQFHDRRYRLQYLFGRCSVSGFGRDTHQKRADRSPQCFDVRRG